MNESGQTGTKTPWLERIRQHINGFMGYEKPENRLHEDERFRQYLNQLSVETMTHVEQLVRSAANEKRLDLLSDFEHMLSTLQRIREFTQNPPKALDSTAAVADDLLTEWHRKDSEYLECLATFAGRVEQLHAPVPERNDVLLLLDTLDRLMQRIRERDQRGGEADITGEAGDD